ncbi:MBL fold metallo-hydrolase [Proteinivorax tanatarense]|uniref:MBL fold metallo-hydrolase n=1 Tax=Proteinivorax tanatarense TaxID=1260629 RepID=A0AAU7VJM4_9FIRM
MCTNIVNGECNVQFLFNSGFLIETKNNILIFDCCKKSRFITDELLSTKKVTVFVSHKHSDHFNPIIYDWSKRHSIQYVVHEDVDKHQGNKVHTVQPDQHFCLEDISIKTLGSTDCGVSFLVEVDGVTLFHSGDLNWWKWEKDSREIQAKEEADYKKELKKLSNKKIDIAFIPVDPRLGEFYHLAVQYFAKNITVSTIFPMHFTQSPKEVESLAKKWGKYNLKPKFIPLLKEGDSVRWIRESPCK